MALFSYEATDAAGKQIKGSMEAADEGALVGRLREMGYLPIGVSRVEAGGAAAASTTGVGFLDGLFKKRVTNSDVLLFTSQMASMLDAGLPLDRSLLILAGLEKNPAFKEVLLGIHRGITGGASLAECLEKHPKAFSDIYVSMVRAGEAGGMLDTVFARTRKHMEASKKLEDDVKSALIYPAMLTVVGGLAVLLMILFVIPKFADVFEDSKAVMPLPTRMLLGFSDVLLKFWWLGLIAAVAGFFGFRKWISTPAGGFAFDSMLLKIPVLGEVVQKTVVSRFSRTLGTLMHGGLPIIEALNISVRTMGNAFMARDFLPVIEGVRRGRGIAVPLKEVGSFPSLAVHMLTVGEETGKLDEMLVKLADNYDQDLSTLIKRLLSLLEPAIIFVMAVVVGFIVISLLLAIFSLNDMKI